MCKPSFGGEASKLRSRLLHSNLPNITHVATKVHVCVLLRRQRVFTWMHDNRNLLYRVKLEESQYKVNIAIITTMTMVTM